MFGWINNIEDYQKIYNYVWRKHKSRIQTERYRWNRKLFNWGNNSKWINEYEAQKSLKSFELYWVLLILISTVTECVSVSEFASLVGMPIGITSSAIGLKFCVITAGIKMYKSTIKKKKQEKILPLINPKLISKEVFISTAFLSLNF